MTSFNLKWFFLSSALSHSWVIHQFSWRAPGPLLPSQVFRYSSTCPTLVTQGWPCPSVDHHMQTLVRFCELTESQKEAGSSQFFNSLSTNEVQTIVARTCVSPPLPPAMPNTRAHDSAVSKPLSCSSHFLAPCLIPDSFRPAPASGNLPWLLSSPCNLLSLLLHAV